MAVTVVEAVVVEVDVDVLGETVVEVAATTETRRETEPVFPAASLTL